MAADLTDELQLLLVEDNPGDARLIRHHLRSDTRGAPAPTVTHVETLDEALNRLQTVDFDLVLLDLGLADSRGIETLERLNDRIDADDDVPPLPIVVLTGLTDDETALRAIQQGAQDYLLKDHLDDELLERALRYALERHRQERRLERQNERLERFASIVSHDLRNPLQVAKGRLAHVDAGDTSEHLDEAVGALDRIEELVDDLLVLAREGRRVDASESVDVGETARSAWENVESPASTLRIDVSGSVTADAGRLTQLFENLFRNSVEHGSTVPYSAPHSTGGGASGRTQSVERDSANRHSAAGVTVTVGAMPDGFYVADDGPGIPDSERDDVFEAGYSTNENGTGFGLDIVREIVEAHGWAVTVVESDDGGARFEITGLSFDDD